MAALHHRALLVAAVLLVGVGAVAAAGVDPRDEEARVLVGTSGHEPADPSPAVATARPRAGGTPSSTSAAPEPSTTSSLIPARPPRPPASARPPARASAPAAQPSSTTSTTAAGRPADPDDPAGPDVVRGRVTDQAGRPIRGICFRSTFPEQHRPQDLGRSDADGRYRIEGGFHTVGIWMCDPAAFEFGWTPVGQFFIARTQLPSGTVTHDVVMKAFGNVRGRVVDQAGRPVEGVVLGLAGNLDLPPTGPDGRFEFRQLEPRTSRPWVYHRTSPTPLTPQQSLSEITVHAGAWSDVTVVIGPWTPWGS